MDYSFVSCITNSRSIYSNIIAKQFLCALTMCYSLMLFALGYESKFRYNFHFYQIYAIMFCVDMYPAETGFVCNGTNVITQSIYLFCFAQMWYLNILFHVSTHSRPFRPTDRFFIVCLYIRSSLIIFKQLIRSFIRLIESITMSRHVLVAAIATIILISSMVDVALSGGKIEVFK